LWATSDCWWPQWTWHLPGTSTIDYTNHLYLYQVQSNKSMNLHDTCIGLQCRKVCILDWGWVGKPRWRMGNIWLFVTSIHIMLQKHLHHWLWVSYLWHIS
jgi:hypothetical protein